MPTQDLETLQKVTNEWLSGAGIALTVRIPLAMLQQLANTYGASFSVEHAAEALTSLANNATRIRENLLKIHTTREHP